MEKQAIQEELQRIEEDAVFSAKGHFEASAFWHSMYYWLGIPSAILSAIAGASALSKFEYHAEIAGVLAIIVAILSSVSVFLNPQQKLTAHHRAGTDYKTLQNDSRVFRSVSLNQSLNPEEQLLALNDRRSELNRKSPGISRRFFQTARHGIEGGESTYRVDRH
jgi:hypothetical protein